VIVTGLTAGQIVLWTFSWAAGQPNSKTVAGIRVIDGNPSGSLAPLALFTHSDHPSSIVSVAMVKSTRGERLLSCLAFPLIGDDLTFYQQTRWAHSRCGIYPMVPSLISSTLD